MFMVLLDGMYVCQLDYFKRHNQAKIIKYQYFYFCFLIWPCNICSFFLIFVLHIYQLNEI